MTQGCHERHREMNKGTFSNTHTHTHTHLPCSPTFLTSDPNLANLSLFPPDTSPVAAVPHIRSLSPHPEAAPLSLSPKLEPQVLSDTYSSVSLPGPPTTPAVPRHPDTRLVHHPTSGNSCFLSQTHHPNLIKKLSRSLD